MELRVRVSVNARKESVEEAKDGRLFITVRAPRKEGLANARLVYVLAKYYSVPENHVRILRGHERSSKVVLVIFSE